MTIAELDERMTAKELEAWAQYWTVEPWGCEVEDFRAYNIMLASGAKVPPLEQVFPWSKETFDKSVKVETEDLEQRLSSFFDAYEERRVRATG